MKNKGFTLIELLAVIVVLAVVALIAFPIIAGIIEKTKRSAAYRSVEGYVEAANNAAVLYDLDNNKGINVTEAKHTFTSNVDTEDFSKIKAKGTLPTYSYLDFDINKKVVTEGHFCINGYSVLYSDGTAKASETKYCEEDNTGSGSNSGNGNGGSTPNSSTVLTYNPETDFFGAVNPNTGEWKDLVYAGFRDNDLIHNAWSGGTSAIYVHNQGNVSGNVAITNGNYTITDSTFKISGTSSGSGNTSFPVYYVVLKIPFYITESNVLNLIGTTTNSHGNFQTHIFLCRTPELGNITTGNFRITDERVLTIDYHNGAGSKDVSFRNTNLKDLVSSKWNDFENPFYIGFAISSNWSGPNGTIDISKLTIGS